MVVLESASGATRLSQIDATIAPSATDAFSRWTTIVPGSLTVSDFTTTNTSYAWYSIAWQLLGPL
jgi:hypothetical protein